jgi:hypothetical protein
MRHSSPVRATYRTDPTKETPMPRIASAIVLAAAATLTATANARDFITRISDTAWSVNGRMVQRMGNLVMWDTGSAFITPQGAFGRNSDTIPGVIPGNPYGMFGGAGLGNPGFGDCTSAPSCQGRLPSIDSMNVDPLQPFRPANFGPMIGELGRW